MSDLEKAPDIEISCSVNNVSNDCGKDDNTMHEQNNRNSDDEQPELMIVRRPPPSQDETSPSSSPSSRGYNRDPDWDEEYRHYHKICATFKKYKKFSYGKVDKTLGFIRSMPKRHQILLRDYRKHIEEIRRCIDVNHNLFQLMILDASSMFENHDEVYPQTLKTASAPEPTAFDYDKLQAVLKHIVRDWTVEGQKERDTCYKPLIDEVETLYGNSRVDGYSDIKILIPGAGMGRLSHELVRRGYIVQGNEFSLFMLFASNFILNKCSGKAVYKCHPWIHQNTNVLKSEDQTREVSFPDVDPCDLPANSGCRFSMTAGDFLEAYATPAQESAWDCVVTCFFIDCASNIITYLERIFSCLKDGGIWLNLGPLLYHYSDLAEEDSVEPPFDFLVDIIQKIGFVIEKQDTAVPTMYAENERSLLSYSYKSIFLVCRKPIKEQPSAVA
ncbi:Carnosine N-methyltransferase [Orchesella cincta]|uniref:carnosine N-methyltransferase n=1 Tax=Orchesella cincta TaxID=48709 RepID=A0A1D2MI09_ORCCI|nr:Carnosine N-methyltransferase [Orchesella cincta]